MARHVRSVRHTARDIDGKADLEVGDKLPVLCLCGDVRNYAFSQDSKSVVGWDAVIVIADDQDHQLTARLDLFETIEPVQTVEVRRGASLVVRLHLYDGKNYLMSYPTTPFSPTKR